MWQIQDFWNWKGHHHGDHICNDLFAPIAAWSLKAYYCFNCNIYNLQHLIVQNSQVVSLRIMVLCNRIMVGLVFFPFMFNKFRVTVNKSLFLLHRESFYLNKFYSSCWKNVVFATYMFTVTIILPREKVCKYMNLLQLSAASTIAIHIFKESKWFLFN